MEGSKTPATGWSTSARTLSRGLAKGIEDGGKLVEHEVKHLGDDVIGWAKDAWHVFSPSQVFAEIGTNLVQGLAQGISNSKQLATAAMDDVDVLSKLSADVVTFRQTMSTVAPAMNDAIAGVSGFGSALGALEARLTSSSSGMGANLKVSMYNVGVDMAQGLIDGLADAQSNINQTMDNIGKSLVATAKAATGSHSPSTIFAGIGNDVMTGLQQGLTSGTSGAVDALTKAGQALVSTGTNQLQRLNALGSNVNYGPSSAATSDIETAGAQPAGAGGTGSTTITNRVVLQVDGRQMGEVVWQYLLNKATINGSAGQFLMTKPVTGT